MRKPREFNAHGPYSHCFRAGVVIEEPRVYVGGRLMSVKQLRRFAAWLLKAADWLEEKEGEK